MSQFAAAIDLSALDGTLGFKIVGTGPVNSLIGNSVASVGDFNNDGVDDVIIGAYGPTSGPSAGTGGAYLVFGDETGFGATLDLATLSAGQGAYLAGVTVGDLTGRSVAGIGDINGDGISDLAIGAPSADIGGVTDLGGVYVVFGSTGGAVPALSALDGSNGFLIQGATNVSTGYTVCSVGDVNADGLADMAISAPGENSASGAAYIVYGRVGGFSASLDLADLDGSDGFRIGGFDGTDFGFSVSRAGDINGDGIDDMIFGALLGSPPGRANAGESYVVFGKAGGFGANFDLSVLDGSNGFVIYGATAGDVSGFSTCVIGDVNGDGFADMAVGAPASDPNGLSNAGGVFIIYGAAGGLPAGIDLAALNGSDGSRIDGQIAGAQLGASVQGAGDVNCDGFDDLVIGASFANGAAGITYVLFGSAAGFGTNFDISTLNGDNGFIITGAGVEQCGSAVSAAGDINGDGLDDLIVGAIDNGHGPGAAYIIYGALPGEAVTRFGSLIGQTIHGGNFNDVLHGLGGGDLLIGHDGRDLLDGGTGDDTLVGGLGADTLSGGAGSDTASYADAAKGVRVDLSITTGQNTSGAGTDTLVSIENLDGSAFADILTGNAKANTLTGEAGKDRLIGGAGDDHLDGGQGADKLTGGAGADVMTGGVGKDIFVFLDLSDSTKQHADLITDLTNADRIDLHTIDANANVAGNQAFHLVSTLSGHAGEAALSFSSKTGLTSLSLDVDGDGKADMVITMTGDHHDFTNFTL